jgi:MinD superfamily P-loop ATPase
MMSGFMITVEQKSCTRCGICLKEFEGYCMSNDNGLPVIDRRICNLCQKCVAICPQQALILLKGNTHVSETKNSAHYILASIIMYCESLSVGSCLMDSLRLTLNTKKMRRKLGIPKKEKVLGVLSLGYAAEKIVNIPRGYRLHIKWNSWN